MADLLVLAIDPGVTCGFAEGYLALAPAGGAFEVSVELRAGEWPAEVLPHLLEDRLAEPRRRKPGGRVIVLEYFAPRRVWTKDFATTVELIGVIKYLHGKHHTTMITVPPQGKRPGVALLRRTGAWESLRGKPHARDAAAHLLAYAASRGKVVQVILLAP